MLLCPLDRIGLCEDSDAREVASRFEVVEELVVLLGSFLCRSRLRATLRRTQILAVDRAVRDAVFKELMVSLPPRPRPVPPLTSSQWEDLPSLVAWGESCAWQLLAAKKKRDLLEGPRRPGWDRVMDVIVNVTSLTC